MQPFSARQAIFWIHLITGVGVGAVVFIMSATGVLLTYERQVNAWADTRRYDIEATPDAPRLQPEAILQAARTAVPDAAPTTLTLFSDVDRPPAVAFGARTLHVHPYTGAVLGEAAPQPRAFFRKMTDWHRWLGTSGEGRTIGRAITGACNLGFLLLLATGAYLWIPRTLSWPQVRNVLWFRRGLPGKARDFQLAQHHGHLERAAAPGHRRQRRRDVVPVGERSRLSRGRRGAAGAAGTGACVSHAQRAEPVRRSRAEHRCGLVARHAARPGVAQHHVAHSRAGCDDGGVHDRLRHRRRAAEAGNADAQPRHRGRCALGTVRGAQPGTPPAFLRALRPHR
jgi:hypothetical protein